MPTCDVSVRGMVICDSTNECNDRIEVVTGICYLMLLDMSTSGSFLSSPMTQTHRHTDTQSETLEDEQKNRQTDTLIDR